MGESIPEPGHGDSRRLRDEDPMSWRRDRVLVLRDRVQRRTYNVDPEAVAESIIDAVLELVRGTGLCEASASMTNGTARAPRQAVLRRPPDTRVPR
jgi:hypothetical protein